MNFAALQVVLISVLSPILIAAGILYVLTTAQINLTAIALNFGTILVGWLRFALDISQRYRASLTFLFVVFLVLALTANIQVGRKYISAKKKKPVVSRIEFEPPNAWVVYKGADERRIYKFPKAFLKNHNDLAGSDVNLRITCENDINPIEGTFTIDEKYQIIIPENILSILHSSQMIRFEILP
jgi:hypothetical protein